MDSSLKGGRVGKVVSISTLLRVEVSDCAQILFPKVVCSHTQYTNTGIIIESKYNSVWSFDLLRLLRSSTALDISYDLGCCMIVQP